MKQLFRTLLFVFFSFAISSYGMAGVGTPEFPCPMMQHIDCDTLMMETNGSPAPCCDGMDGRTKPSLSCKVCQACHTAPFIPPALLKTSLSYADASPLLLTVPTSSFISQKPSSVWRPPRIA